MRLRSFFRRGLLPLAVALLPALCAAEEYAPLTYLTPGVNLEKITTSTRFYDTGQGAYYWTVRQNQAKANELYNRTHDFSFMGALARLVPQTEFNEYAFRNLVGDRYTGWFNAGSNAIQYWQDIYGPFFKRMIQRRDLPQGLTYSKDNLEMLGGTQSLMVNLAFYDRWPDVGGTAADAFNWYLSGTTGYAGGGFFQEYYTDCNACTVCDIYSSQGVVDMGMVTDGIFESFGLKRLDDRSLLLVDQGLIPTISATNYSDSRPLTCYGFTLGTDGMVNSLYITDSEDAQYRIEHIYLKVETDAEGFQRLLMFEDEECTKGWHSTFLNQWGITDICHIRTPELLKEMYTELHDPKTPMEWTGESSYWSTDTNLGWDVTVRGETYTSGYENGRIARFTDASYEFKIFVEGEVVATRMEVTNERYNYQFLLGRTEASLEIGTLDKTGKGELRFEGFPLTVDTLKLAEGSPIVFGTSVSINSGTINGNLAVGEDATLTLGKGDFSGTGNISLGSGAQLLMGGHTLDCSVTLQGAGASAVNGTIKGDLILGNGVSYTWKDEAGLQLAGNVRLGGGAAFDLGAHTLAGSVSVQGTGATIKNGIVSGNLILEDGASYTWDDAANLQLKGNISLGNDATFDLGKVSRDTSLFTFAGSSTTIGNGTLNGDLTVAAGKRITLLAGTAITGSVILENEAAFDMGGSTFHIGGEGGNKVVLNGSATIGHGTLDGSLTVAEGRYLTLLADTTVTGTVTLESGTTFDMGGNTFHIGGDAGNQVVLNGSVSSIGHGTLDGSLTVAENKSLTLLADTTITGTVTLNNGTTFDMGGNTFHIGGDAGNQVALNGSISGIGNGTLNGSLAIDQYKTLKLCGDLSGTGSISLGNNATLDLGGHTLAKALNLNGYATIGNGTLDVNVTVAADKCLYLSGDLSGTGTISLKDSSVLDLRDHTLSNAVSLSKAFYQSELSAEIRRGTLDGDVTMDEGTELVMNRTTGGEGTILLGEGARLTLRDCTSLTNSVSLTGSEASIQGGGFDGRVTVGADQKLSLRGNLTGSGAISLGANAKVHLRGYTYSGSVDMGSGALISLDSSANTAIKTREGVDHTTLDKVRVSFGLISGTDSEASLLDGLDIDHKGADLTLENLILTDNNSILVGEGHTITLKNVTIRLTDETFDRENPQDGVYYFDLTNLFHCSVDMENVVFDASDVSLPLDFDLKDNGISFYLGDATLTPETASRDISLLMAGYGSQTMEIDTQGRPVFTELVKTPEPTTGTLSLLALCALAARRRRRK